ncbi:hypothetical protein FE810_16150, partial [Thalassotalea litorea]
MKFKLSQVSLAMLSASTMAFGSMAYAQEAEETTQDIEVIEVSGIRSALTNAVAEKQSANNLKEVIQAVDIGKLPDQNLAEVL